jgi:hypothetical protein
MCRDVFFSFMLKFREIFRFLPCQARVGFSVDLAEFAKRNNKHYTTEKSSSLELREFFPDQKQLSIDVYPDGRIVAFNASSRDKLHASYKELWLKLLPCRRGAQDLPKSVAGSFHDASEEVPVGVNSVDNDAIEDDECEADAAAAPPPLE